MTKRHIPVRYKSLCMFISWFFILNSLPLHGNPTSVQGVVVNDDGNSISYATVIVKNSQKGTLTDEEGYFVLNDINLNDSIIYIQYLGYKTETILLNNDILQQELINVVLKPSAVSLDEIFVTAKSSVSRLKAEAYSVSALNVGKLQNSTRDISSLLGQVTGINIREEGGLGSGFKFSINGMSGKQVKFFIDGVPMDNFGGSYNISNIPVNLIDQVEVYKGVVPVWLGSDALGGAVNVVTRDDLRSYLDVSASYGSFNTQKIAISGKYTFQENSILLMASAYYNYSDNNYRVDDLEVHDELGNIVGTTSAERFHDSYKSAMFQAKTGFQNKSFADKFLVGITLSGNLNNIQHGLSLERVFGQVHTRDRIIMPGIEYEKKDLFIKGLNFSSINSYLDGLYNVIDTSSREYSWDGSYVVRNNPAIGESDWQKTFFSFYDNTILSVNNIKYNTNYDEIAFNYTYTLFKRQGDDPYDPDIVPFSEPNFLKKNVWGLSYTRNFFHKKISSTVFTKYFMYEGKVVEEDLYSEGQSKKTHEDEFRKPGFGIAGRWHITNWLQVKSSFESTYRLPDGSELFGDGLNVLSNPQLQAEQSNNMNAGVLLKSDNGRINFQFESNYFYRNAENLIRLAADGAKSEYVNLAKATIQGIESEISLNKRKKFQIAINATYQNLVNKTKYDENGQLNHTYLDRVPNTPYFFANLNISKQFDGIIAPADQIRLNWYSRYVNEFFLQWPGHGLVKHTIPTQFVHNIEFNYSLRDGRYNASLLVSNLFDSKAYDNFRIQKPGRAVHIKLRYFLN